MKTALKTALSERGYDTLTPVQEEVSNPELDHCDLLVSAQTGSGKTVGFGLAIASDILGSAEAFAAAKKPLGLVIAPTRELALQVKRELQWLYAKAGVIMASCVGGMDMRDERRALERGAHIVVATPGRLRDHIRRSSIDLTQICAVVLDEADEMLDLGFAEDLEFILSETPESRRTLLFSATVPKGIANLAKKYQTNAIRITTTAEKSQHADIDYQVIEVGKNDSENAIINVLRFHESPNAIVFANTRATVARLTTRLSNRGFSVVSLSGELSQGERSHALQAMRDGRARICVATDVAARGIDLPKLDLVVHAELPSNHETLLHRSGRTGRAGRKGTSALIVPPNTQRKAERILSGAKLQVNWGTPPSADEIIAKDYERMLQDDVWTQEISPEQEEMIASLLEKFGANRVAAAFLETYNARFSAPEDIMEFTPAPPRREKRSHEDFGPSTWLRLSKGRQDGISPGQIVPMLCSAGNITNSEIGAIRIQGDHSFIELHQKAVDQFLQAIGPAAKVEGATIEALSYVPDIRPDPRGRPSQKPRQKRAVRVHDDDHSYSKPRTKKPREKAKSYDPIMDAPQGFKKKPKFTKSNSQNNQEYVSSKSEQPTKKPRSTAPAKGPARNPNASADPSQSMRAPKAGKPNSKKNKLRRAETDKSGGKNTKRGESSGNNMPKRRG